MVKPGLLGAVATVSLKTKLSRTRLGVYVDIVCGTPGLCPDQGNVYLMKKYPGVIIVFIN